MRAPSCFSAASLLLTAIAMIACGREAAAQSDASMRDELRACATERRDSQRLECYDAIARTVSVTDAPSAAPAPPPADFGLQPQRPPPAEPPPEAQQIVSTVSALREIQPGRLEITLANGQVWRQTNSDRYPLEVGHEVRIYPTRFGSYFRLAALELRAFVQVERVR